MTTKKKTNLMFLATLITVGGTIIVALINGWFNTSSKVQGAEQSIVSPSSDSSKTNVQNIQIKQGDSGKVEINNISGNKIDKQINNYYPPPTKPKSRHLTKADIKKLETEIPKGATVDFIYLLNDKEANGYAVEIEKQLNKMEVIIRGMAIGAAMDGGEGKRFEIVKTGENAFQLMVNKLQ